MADGGGGQNRLYIVIYSVQKKNLAVSEGGGLVGFYCTYSKYKFYINSLDYFNNFKTSFTPGEYKTEGFSIL